MLTGASGLVGPAALDHAEGACPNRRGLASEEGVVEQRPCIQVIIALDFIKDTRCAIERIVRKEAGHLEKNSVTCTIPCLSWTDCILGKP